MRVLLRIFFVSIATMTLMLMVGITWLYFDPRGLPDTKSLKKFAPSASATVTDDCLKSTSVAIPYESVGMNMREALRVSGYEENSPGVLNHLVYGFKTQTVIQPIPLSLIISRTMICEDGKPLDRQLNEIRIAVQLERHFTKQEIFIIAVNRLYFGQDIVGVEAASQHYYHKESSQLRAEEAALLAGLLKSPNRFSPIKHPDRAIERRNELIDAMLQDHFISETEAQAEKESPLHIMDK